MIANYVVRNLDAIERIRADPNYQLRIYANVNVKLRLRTAAASNRCRTAHGGTFVTKRVYVYIKENLHWKKGTDRRCKLKSCFVILPFGWLPKADWLVGAAKITK